jgi:hypothetical protein
MRCIVCQSAPSVIVDQTPVNLSLNQDSQQPMMQRVKKLWQRHAAKARAVAAMQVTIARTRAGSALRTYASAELVKITGTNRMDSSSRLGCGISMRPSSPVVNDPASRSAPSNSTAWSEPQADGHGVSLISGLMITRSSGQHCAV